MVVGRKLVRNSISGYMIFRGISWATKDKIQQANYFGSLTQASAIRVGSFQGEEFYAPFKSLLPMVYIYDCDLFDGSIFSPFFFTLN